jgi:hypothetical protein
MTMHIECTGWRPFERNTLTGFANFHISALGLTIQDCAVHQKGDQAWVQLPAKPRLDTDRNLVRNPQSGKVEYTKVLSFEDKTMAQQFRTAAVKALLKREPNALNIREADECLPQLI